ncbi:MAG TPA: hypothetical protein VMT21_06420, partial [Gemmatimonadales bacterium]|nr:hypothetical protein [Gemmatimonadales bacterium]
MIGYVAGRSPLHRAHPYTTLTLAGAVLFAAFAMTEPATVWLLVLAGAALAATGGVLRPSARTALAVSLPIWALLFVLYGLMGADPRVAVGPLSLSAPGIARALV